jgi:hypothetical protein
VPTIRSYKKLCVDANKNAFWQEETRKTGAYIKTFDLLSLPRSEVCRVCVALDKASCGVKVKGIRPDPRSALSSTHSLFLNAIAYEGGQTENRGGKERIWCSTINLTLY